MLKQSEYDAAYFGDPNSDLKRKSGYSNYLEETKSQDYLKIPEKCFEQVSGKIVELGCGIGVYVKEAKLKGLDWLGLDNAKWCIENAVTDIIRSDALTYLKNLNDNSIGYIVSFNFLDCCTDEYLMELKKEINRVGKNHICYSTKDPNPKYYNKNVFEIFDEVKVIG